MCWLLREEMNPQRFYLPVWGFANGPWETAYGLRIQQQKRWDLKQQSIVPKYTKQIIVKTRTKKSKDSKSTRGI